MNLDDTISKINSIDSIALKERLRIKPYSDKATKEDYLHKHGDLMTGKLNVAPKVWLTVEEAKRMLAFVEQVNIVGDELNQYIFQIFYPLKKGIEQAEAQK